MQHPKQNNPSSAQPFWHPWLQDSAEPYDLSRHVEHDQQIYRENRLARHVTPHLLDQAMCLLRMTNFPGFDSSGEPRR